MSLLEKVHKLQGILKSEGLKVDELIAGISELLGCNTYLVNLEGVIVCSTLPNGADCSKVGKEALVLKSEFKQRMGFIFQITANLPLEGCFLHDGSCAAPNTFMTIVPIRNVRTAPGHLLLTKRNQPFSDEELVLAESASLAACIYFYENDSGAGSESDIRQKANAQLVLDSLSFSELKAISNVFNDLNGLEGFLVASKIADRINISRSVIVNAMRKLESAGVVDSRSLGIKGTYIKIKNEHFLQLLKDRVKN